jgi:hypothetical protein
MILRLRININFISATVPLDGFLEAWTTLRAAASQPLANHPKHSPTQRQLL